MAAASVILVVDQVRLADSSGAAVVEQVFVVAGAMPAAAEWVPVTLG